MSALEKLLPRELPEPRNEDSRGAVLKHAANELVFAVVGHVGSGTSEIAERLLPFGGFGFALVNQRSSRQTVKVNQGAIPHHRWRP